MNQHTALGMAQHTALGCVIGAAMESLPGDLEALASLHDHQMVAIILPAVAWAEPATPADMDRWFQGLINNRRSRGMGDLDGFSLKKAFKSVTSAVTKVTKAVVDPTEADIKSAAKSVPQAAKAVVQTAVNAQADLTGLTPHVQTEAERYPTETATAAAAIASAVIPGGQGFTPALLATLANQMAGVKKAQEQASQQQAAQQAAIQQQAIDAQQAAAQQQAIEGEVIQAAQGGGFSGAGAQVTGGFDDLAQGNFQGFATNVRRNPWPWVALLAALGIVWFEMEH